MDYSILIPFDKANADRRRIETLDWVRRFWAAHAPGAEIIVGGRGHGNRSENRNHLARKAKADLLVWIDDTVIVNPRDMARLVEAARRSAQARFEIHGWLKRDTGRFLTERTRPEAAFPSLRPAHCSHTERRHPGLIYCMRRETWAAVGGFDERFRVWGLEDVAFHAAVGCLVGPTEYVDGTAWHIYHRQEADRREGQGWAENVRLKREYLRLAKHSDQEGMRVLIDSQRQQTKWTIE